MQPSLLFERRIDILGIFKNWTKKAVSTVKEVTSEIAVDEVSDKVSIWSGIATIGAFVVVTISSIVRTPREKERKSHRTPDYSTITINNYYYREEDEHGKRINRRA